MSASLVGSEMCIRDRAQRGPLATAFRRASHRGRDAQAERLGAPVRAAPSCRLQGIFAHGAAPILRWL
eukprot:2241462-Alexandrium_andersonii.AAC.1